MQTIAIYPVAVKSFSGISRRVLVVHCEYKQPGGESAVVKEEIKLLQATGNNVSLLQFNNSKNSLLKWLQLPFNLSAYFKTLEKIRAFKPDVVHIHNLHFGGTASVIYAAKKQHIPVVMTLHNFRLLCPSATLFHKGKMFLDSLQQNFCSNAIKKGVYQNSTMLTAWLAVSMWLHQKLGTLQLVDRYILLSPHALSLFSQSKLKLTKEQLTIKPNFISPPPVADALRSDQFLFIGRLSEEKGVDILLETFSRSGHAINIAGDGPDKHIVLNYCQRFPNIKYLGALDKAGVYRELQQCTALVFPSVWYEGMPVTIIEAFACGTAVIASNTGAMMTMVKHGYNGFHFETGNTTDLVKRLKQWTAMNTAAKETYGSNALQTYLKFYTPEKNVAQLMSVYDDVIARQYKLSVA